MQMRQKILIVANDPATFGDIENAIPRQSEWLSAANPSEAELALARFVPDLIILDLNDPGSTSCDFVRSIRRNQTLQKVYVILISSRPLAEHRLKAYEAGTDSYLLKPFSYREIETKIKFYLRLAENERKTDLIIKELQANFDRCSLQLQIAEKAALLGIRTAEIVHNLNNPVTTLIMSLSQLEASCSDRKMLKRAENAAIKIKRIIQSILQSAQQNADQSDQLVDLNEVIKVELDFLEAAALVNSEIRLQTNLGSIGQIKGQPTHFGQAFGNLIKNAVDSMHGLTTKELRVSTSESDDLIIVEIADTGCGIEDANLKKIFDPFFTTKLGRGRDGLPSGTGLGLSSVRHTLGQYGARIVFKSTVGVGTQVRVEVPIQHNHGAADDQKREAIRIATLGALEILDTIREPIFNDLVELATLVSAAPIGAISLIDSDRQWFKATVGLGGIRETTRDISICSHTIQGDHPFIIESTTEDPRFSANPMVSGSPGIRFYAGFPLIARDRHAIGALCVIDQVTRTLTPEQVSALNLISRQVMVQIELRQQILLRLRGDRSPTLEDSLEQLKIRAISGVHELSSTLRSRPTALPLVDRLLEQVREYSDLLITPLAQQNIVRPQDT